MWCSRGAIGNLTPEMRAAFLTDLAGGLGPGDALLPDALLGEWLAEGDADLGVLRRHVEHALRPGSSVFIPGDVWHGARNTGHDVLRLLYVFAADSFSDVNYVFPDLEQP